MPSLVAEIGEAIESHMRMIGMIKDEGLNEQQKKLIAEKRAQYEGSVKQAEETSPGDFPDGAQVCKKCSVKAAIRMDGCMTCLNCGDSKCG